MKTGHKMGSNDREKRISVRLFLFLAGVPLNILWDTLSSESDAMITLRKETMHILLSNLFPFRKQNLSPVSGGQQTQEIGEQNIEQRQQDKQSQGQNFLATETFQDILCLLQEQPEPHGPQVSKSPIPLGLLTQSYNNYHVLAEKLKDESLLLSYQVHNPEIAKHVEEHYSTAAKKLEAIGELMAIVAQDGILPGEPSELEILVLNEIAFTNTARHMKEVYNIASTPVLDEMRAEVTDRVDNLIRLQKKQKKRVAVAKGFDYDLS